MKPVSRSLPTIATARKRLMVAIEPLSKYLNGLLRRLALEPAVDLLGGVLRALDRDLGDAGQVVEGDHVADDEDLGVARAA